MIISTAVDLYGVRLLPWLDVVTILPPVGAFFAVLFPLWIMGERNPPHKLFFTF